MFVLIMNVAALQRCRLASRYATLFLSVLMSFRLPRLSVLLAGALLLGLLAPVPAAHAQEALLRLADTPDARRVVVYVARDDGTPVLAQPERGSDLVLAFRPAGDQALTLPDVNTVLKKVTLKQGTIAVGATEHAKVMYDGARVLTAHYPAERVLDLGAPFLVLAPTGPTAALYLGDLPVGTPTAPASPPDEAPAPGGAPNGAPAGNAGGAVPIGADAQASADAPTIYDTGSVDTPPEPEGGQEALYRQVRYPPRAQARGIQGNVFVQFVVHKDGRVSSIEVVRGVHELLDKEAARAIREAAFRPAQRAGEPVACRTTQMVPFVLE